MNYKQYHYLGTICLAIFISSCSKDDPKVVPEPQPEPEPEPVEYYWSAISTGQAHSLALSDEGKIYVWGDNTDGQLGNGTTAHVGRPTLLNSTKKWAKALTGYAHSLAIADDGTLWAWGLNDRGQLGLGTAEGMIMSPTQVGTDTDWESIAVGGNHSLAIKKDGSLWSWGSHDSGQLGNGQTSGQTTVPTRVGSDSNWAKVFACNNWKASFAIKTDGSLWAWGTGQNYMLGTGSTSAQDTPIEVGQGRKWKKVSYARSRNTFALAEDGTLWAVGRNNKSLLQINTTTKAQQTWAQVGTDNDWEDIAIFNLTAMAVKKNGDVYGWGANSYGELGNGAINEGSADEQYVKTITKIEGLSNVKEVALGFNFSLVRRDKSKSLCIAGSNFGDFPALGTGDAKSAPVLKHQCDITLF